MIRNLRVSLLLPLIPKVIEIVAFRNDLVIVFDLTIWRICLFRVFASEAFPGFSRVNVLDGDLNVARKSNLAEVAQTSVDDVASHVENSDFLIYPHALVSRDCLSLAKLLNPS